MGSLRRRPSPQHVLGLITNYKRSGKVYPHPLRFEISQASASGGCTPEENEQVVVVVRQGNRWTVEMGWWVYK